MPFTVCHYPVLESFRLVQSQIQRCTCSVRTRDEDVDVLTVGDFRLERSKWDTNLPVDGEIVLPTKFPAKKINPVWNTPAL